MGTNTLPSINDRHDEQLYEGFDPIDRVEIIYRQVQRLDELLAHLQVLPRRLILLMAYLLSFLMLGSPGWKALLAAIAVAALMFAGIGTRRLEQLAVVLFLVAVALWLELPYLQATARNICS